MAVDFAATLTLGFVPDGELANVRNHVPRICFTKSYRNDMVLLSLLKIRPKIMLR